MALEHLLKLYSKSLVYIWRMQHISTNLSDMKSYLILNLINYWYILDKPSIPTTKVTYEGRGEKNNWNSSIIGASYVACILPARCASLNSFWVLYTQCCHQGKLCLVTVLYFFKIKFWSMASPVLDVLQPPEWWSLCNCAWRPTTDHWSNWGSQFSGPIWSRRGTHFSTLTIYSCGGKKVNTATNYNRKFLETKFQVI